MASDEPTLSPRRAAAAAWLSALLTLGWARYSLVGFEGGWAAVLIGVVAVVAFGLPLALRSSTRDLGLGLCLGAASGLVIAAVVALAV